MLHRFFPPADCKDLLPEDRGEFSSALLANLKTLMDLIYKYSSVSQQTLHLIDHFLNLFKFGDLPGIKLEDFRLFFEGVNGIPPALIALIFTYYDNTHFLIEIFKSLFKQGETIRYQSPDGTHKGETTTVGAEISRCMDSFLTELSHVPSERQLLTNGMLSLFVPWENFTNLILNGFPQWNELTLEMKSIRVYPDTCVLSARYITEHRNAFPAKGLILARMEEACHCPAVFFLNGAVIHPVLASVPDNDTAYRDLHRRIGYPLDKKTEIAVLSCKTPNDKSIRLGLMGSQEIPMTQQRLAVSNIISIKDAKTGQIETHQFVLFNPSNEYKDYTLETVYLSGNRGVNLRDCSCQFSVMTVDEFKRGQYTRLFSQGIDAGSCKTLREDMERANVSYTFNDMTIYHSDFGFCMLPCYFESNVVTMSQWQTGTIFKPFDVCDDLQRKVKAQPLFFHHKPTVVNCTYDDLITYYLSARTILTSLPQAPHCERYLALHTKFTRAIPYPNVTDEKTRESILKAAQHQLANNHRKLMLKIFVEIASSILWETAPIVTMAARRNPENNPDPQRQKPSGRFVTRGVRR